MGRGGGGGAPGGEGLALDLRLHGGEGAGRAQGRGLPALAGLGGRGAGGGGRGTGHQSGGGVRQRCHSDGKLESAGRRRGRRQRGRLAGWGLQRCTVGLSRNLLPACSCSSTRRRRREEAAQGRLQLHVITALGQHGGGAALAARGGLGWAQLTGLGGCLRLCVCLDAGQRRRHRRHHVLDRHRQAGPQVALSTRAISSSCCRRCLHAAAAAAAAIATAPETRALASPPAGSFAETAASRPVPWLCHQLPTPYPSAPLQHKSPFPGHCVNLRTPDGALG